MHLRDHTLSIALLDEMEAAGMPANAEGYATVIRTCARCGKKEEAVFVYSESLRLCIAPSKVETVLRHSVCRHGAVGFCHLPPCVKNIRRFRGVSLFFNRGAVAAATAAFLDGYAVCCSLDVGAAAAAASTPLFFRLLFSAFSATQPIF